MVLDADRPFATDNARNLSSLQSQWITAGIVDATAAAADGALGVTERTFTAAAAIDNAVQILALPPSWVGIEIQLECATDNHDGILDVYVGRVDSDVARRICTLTWINGTQQGDGSGLELIDTITVTNEKWYGDIDSVTGAAEHIAGVFFNLYGYSKIMFHGHTTFDGDLTVKVAGA